MSRNEHALQSCANLVQVRLFYALLSLRLVVNTNFFVRNINAKELPGILNIGYILVTSTVMCGKWPLLLRLHSDASIWEIKPTPYHFTHKNKHSLWPPAWQCHRCLSAVRKNIRNVVVLG